MMMYATHFSSVYAGVIGLFIFFAFFIGMIVWVYRPGAKAKYQKDALIPLKDDDHEQR